MNHSPHPRPLVPDAVYRLHPWRRGLLGNCSRRCSTSCIHAVVGNCSRRCSRQLLLHCSTFAHPWARTSCIHAVVGNCSRLCSRQLLLHCSTFAHPWARTSYIHAVVPEGEGKILSSAVPFIHRHSDCVRPTAV